MIRRLALLAVIAAGLSPGLVWRNAPAAPDYGSALTVRPIPVPVARIGPFAVEGVWQLASGNARFGGYSALVATAPDRLFAVSDDGRMLAMSLGRGGPGNFVMGDYGPRTDQDKAARDIESVTRDPGSGRLWAGYEYANAIERRDADLGAAHRVQPPGMHDWSDNAGPESLTRLPDGRFIVLSEGARRSFGAVHAAILFPSDPVAAAKGRGFSIRMPEGYDPSDMAALPDGRVLILGRKISFVPPGFRGIVMLADPATIRPGEVWSGRVLAHLAPPFPTDNYEGLAVVSAPGGGYPVTLWLISDDNKMSLQRTLLAKLRWDGSSTEEK